MSWAQGDKSWERGLGAHSSISLVMALHCGGEGPRELIVMKMPALRRGTRACMWL